MKSITQLHDYGCGLACVAFVSSKSYDEVLNLASPEQAAAAGYYCRELVGLLAQLRLHYEYKYITKKLYPDIFRKGTIVYLKRSKLYPAGHYLARGGNGWMDPWINFNQSRVVSQAKSGFIKELPYRPSYIIRPITTADGITSSQVLELPHSRHQANS